jgi:hypothetical protein
MHHNPGGLSVPISGPSWILSGKNLHYVACFAATMMFVHGTLIDQNPKPTGRRRSAIARPRRRGKRCKHTKEITAYKRPPCQRDSPLREIELVIWEEVSYVDG